MNITKLFKTLDMQIVSAFVLMLICVVVLTSQDASVRLNWIYWPSTLVIAVVAFYFLRKHVEFYQGKSLMAFMFDKDVWLHRSSVNDYIFVSLNYLVFMHVIKAISLYPEPVAQYIYALMSKFTQEPLPREPETWVIVIYTIINIIVLDFALFFAHYLLHKVPILWPLHKVHHSAQRLTPFTAYRSHPLETLFTTAVAAIAIGSTHAVFFYFYPSDKSFITILGVSAFTFIFNALGANLRHSHIRLSYGPIIERFFISPAQHYYHHSAKTKHFDKNMGAMLSIWDRMFGTLYIADKHEEIPLGLSTEKEQKPYDTVQGMVLEPIKEIIKIIIGKRPKN